MRYGFSTGAVAKSDFRRGLQLIREAGASGIELSALRQPELANLMAALPTLDLRRFDHISIHAPSKSDASFEDATVALLQPCLAQGFLIVVHPDNLYDLSKWEPLQSVLCIENMDNRKPIGQTAKDLAPFFARLPEARLCLDIAHAQQVDPTMRVAQELVDRYQACLGEIHLSSVTASSAHECIHADAVGAFRAILSQLPAGIPVVCESPAESVDLIRHEMSRMKECFAR